MTTTPLPAPPPPAPSAFPRARTVGRLRGIPIRLDPSVALIAILLFVNFVDRFSAPGLLGDAGRVGVLAAALLATLLFLLSVLAHEVGHAFTSLDRKLDVVGITLFAMGGVTESVREARRARDDIVVVGVGPFTSLVLGAAFGLAATAVGSGPLAVVFGYLGWTNLLLAVFNVIPAYPLDGGRLLRALLWAASGRPHAATRWAARVGQLFALALAAAGFVEMLGGSLGGALWNLVLAAFLARAATEGHRRARARERLGGVSVADVMGTVPVALPPEMALDVAWSYVRQRPAVPWPVGSPVVGTVTLSSIEAVPADARARTRVADVAHGAEATTVDAAMRVEDALDRLASAPSYALVVTSAGEPVGLLTPRLVAERR